MPDEQSVQPNQRGRDKRQLPKRMIKLSRPQLIAIITISVISGRFSLGAMLVARRRPAHRAGNSPLLHRRFNLGTDVIVGIDHQFFVANSTCT